MNKFSIGIEISNPGPLIRHGDGSFKTTYGAPWTGGVFEGFHPNTPGRGWKFWAEYSPTEIDLCIHLCELLRQTYGVTDVVGHDAVSPGRKSDPGPAYPWSAVRAALPWVQD